jgi:hypothetical protein
VPQEAKFAEVVISEIKKLVCMLYGTLIRFYIPVMRYEDLNEMKEDLIELLTSLCVRGDLSNLILQLCRLGTKDDEVTLSQKFQELKSIRPERIGIDRLFTLNDSSKLIDMFAEQEKNKQGHVEGDVGGSGLIGEEGCNPDKAQTTDEQHVENPAP